MTNSVDPEEMACSQPSHLDLHCFHRNLFWSAGMTYIKDGTQLKSEMIHFNRYNNHMIRYKNKWHQILKLEAPYS